MKQMRWRLQTTVALSVLVILVAACAACARKPLREPLKVKIAVLDMQIPEGFSAQKEIQGWWFGARDVYRNPNAGRLFSDQLAKQLRKLPYLEVHSRIDYKYYVARKLERLRKAYPDLSDKEVAALYDESKPLDIGKDLNHYWGVDKVVYGRIISGGTSHNRTFHWWRSSIAVEVFLLDVETGEVEWRGNFQKTKNFRSEYRTMELVAEDIVRRMVKEYFLKPA
jgi:hypothetical protein